MAILDFSPLPIQYRYLKGQAWDIPIHLQENIIGSFQDYFLEAYIILNGTVIDTLNVTNGGIRITENGRVLNIYKDWFTLSANNSKDIWKQLIKGNVELQLFASDNNGKDSVPFLFKIEITETPDLTTERVNPDYFHTISLVDGFFVKAATSSLYNLTVEASEEATTARDEAVEANDAVQSIKQDLLDASEAAILANQQIQLEKQPLLNASAASIQAKDDSITAKNQSVAAKVDAETARDAAIAAAANQQGKVVSITEYFVANATASSGATKTDNLSMAIPVNSTGNSLYFGIEQSILKRFVGQTFRAKITVAVTNFNQLIGDGTWFAIVQKWQGANNLAILNTGYNVTVTQSTAGNVKTFVYTIERAITQDDIDNNYYYKFYLSLANTNAVTQAVQLSISREFLYTTTIETLLNQNVSSIIQNASDIAAKQSTIVSVQQSFTLNNSSANQAVRTNDNLLTIPASKTGTGSYFGLNLPDAIPRFLGQKLIATITLVINNYNLLNGNPLLNPIVQRIKGGVFQANLNAGFTSSFTDTIVGNVSTRVYTITKDIDAADISNNYTYNFYLSVANTNAVTQDVTFSISRDLNYTATIETLIRQNITNISQNVSDISARQKKQISIPVVGTSTIAVGVAGTTIASNVFTISAGTSGNNSYYGIKQPKADSFVGQILTATIKVVITNSTELQQPVNYAAIVQRFKNNIFQGNATGITTSYTDTLVGSTLTREYTISYTITQSDIDNSYYYGFVIQLKSTTNVNAVVTETFTASIVAVTDLELFVNYINTKVNSVDIFTALRKGLQSTDGSKANVTILTVKADGTGDFTNIQDAIDSITDATIDKQYIVQVASDFSYNTRTQLRGSNIINSMSMSYVFSTKDYVHVEGIGGMKKVEVNLPLDSATNDIQYSQVFYLKGYSRIRNILGTGSAIRYVGHIEGGGVDDAYRLQLIEDCILDHKGNHLAVNFAGWDSDSALGIGNSDGLISKVRNTVLKARKQPVTVHTNNNYKLQSEMWFEYCEFITTQKTYTDSQGEKKLAMNFSDLGSKQRNKLVLNYNKASDGFSIGGSFYTNTDRTDATVFFSNVVGVGNSALDLRFPNIPLLYVRAVANNVPVDVTGGTAMSALWGTTFRKKEGAVDYRAWAVGRNHLPDSTNSHIVNYSDTLGHRLGDCSSINKTLIISVNGIERTIVFDKNYSGGVAVTSPAAYTNAQILAEMNSQISAYCTITIGYSEYASSVTDTYENVSNASLTETLLQGTGVVWDYTSGDKFVRAAVAGERPDGILADDILCQNSNTVADTGKMLLRNKVLINKNSICKPRGVYTNQIGYMAKVGATPGQFVQTTNQSEACLVLINPDTWKFF